MKKMKLSPMIFYPDGRNLAKEWQDVKKKEGKSHAYVTDARQLRDVDMDTEHVMGEENNRT